MEIEIIHAPFSRKLIGIAGQRARGQNFCEVGSNLMDILWPALRSMGVEHHGVLHWVYDSPDDVFVSVEPKKEGMQAPEGVEYRTINYTRYLKYVYLGPYEQLPNVWERLFAQIEALDEVRLGPDMEVYDNFSDEPEERRTTIMIGLLGDA